jgi:hypothetical protein
MLICARRSLWPGCYGNIQWRRPSLVETMITHLEEAAGALSVILTQGEMPYLSQNVVVGSSCQADQVFSCITKAARKELHNSELVYLNLIFLGD